MNYARAFAVALLPLFIYVLACLVAVTTPAVVMAKELADLGLSAEDQLELIELSRMFGNDQPEFALLSVLAAVVPENEAVDTMVSSLELIHNAIEKSGIDTDFSAPPVPTGDELFDRYALIVEEQLNATPLGDALQLSHVAVVPDALLAAWEPEFGDDPRYWELRYLMALIDEVRPWIQLDDAILVPADGAGTDDGADETAPAPVEKLKPIDYLLEAERRGCASANTLLLLYNEVRKENESRLAEFTESELTDENRQPQEPAGDGEGVEQSKYPDELIARAIALHRESEAREAGILEAACFRGHGEAWPRYMRGFNYLSLGEYERGMRDLKQGNSAPINSYPVPFPIKLVEDSLLTSKPAGGPVVNGAIQLMLISYPLPHYITVKERYKDGIVAAELGAGVDEYETWHQFACRFAESRQAVAIQAIVSLVLVKILRSSLIANHEEELSQSQLVALDRLTGAGEQIKNRTRKHFREYEVFGCGITLGLAGGVRGMAVNQYFYMAADARTVHNHALPIFEDLAEFSYWQLRTPRAMEKYEPISDELYQIRRYCRYSARKVHEAFIAALEEGRGAAE